MGTCQQCGCPLTPDNTSPDDPRPTVCEDCAYEGYCALCEEELKPGEDGWCASCRRAEHAD